MCYPDDVDDDISDREIKVLKMLLLIERSRCWRCCCWSKSQNAEDVAGQKDKMLKMLLLIEKVKVLKMLLIERSKWWRCCCWSNNQSAEYVADRKVQVLKMSLLIERSKCWRCCWSKTEDVADDWRWRLHDVEKLPMIYRCVTLLMLMMSPISTLVVVDVAVEYPSR